MRKILSSIMLVAVAAMASVSCQKEEAQAPVEPKSTTLTLHANVEDTKTYIEGNTVLWGTGEYVQLYFNDGDENTADFVKSSAAAADLWDGETNALFSFDINYSEADSYILGGVYPASCVVENSNVNPLAYKVTLPAIQNASASSYDPKAFIMVMQPQTVTTFDTEAHLASFRRAVALNKVTLTGVKENVSSVEITLPEGKYLAGRRYFDLTTGVEGEVYNSQTNTIKVNADYTGSSIDVWFTSWGVELAEGDKVTIRMTSDSKLYTHTISVNSNGLKFVEGSLNKLSVNMATAEEEVLDNLAGEYLIAAMPGEWVLMTETVNTTSSNHYFERVASEVSSSAVNVLSSDFYGVENIENYVWMISEVDGGYAVQNKSTEKYLSWTSGNSAVYSETPVAFSVSINDDKSGSIVHLTTTDRSLQYNSGSPRFAFYTSTQKPLYFIPWVEDTTPRISVSTKSIEVDADETSCEFTYELHNVTGIPEVSVDTDVTTMTEVVPSVDGNIVTVTVTFAANEDGTAKNATIVLSIDGADDVEVVITQAAYKEPGVSGGAASAIPCYVLSDNFATGSNNSYAGNCDIKVGDITWNLTGNSTMNPWRMGGKNLTNADRALYTKTPYPSALSKVEFISGTATSVTWNSLKLVYSTSADFTNSQTITVSEVGANKTISFEPEGGFPENCYYKFILNVTIGSSNKYVQVSDIKFYGYEN